MALQFDLKPKAGQSPAEQSQGAAALLAWLTANQKQMYNGNTTLKGSANCIDTVSSAMPSTCCCVCLHHSGH